MIPQNGRHCPHPTKAAMVLLASFFLSLVCRQRVGDTFWGLGVSDERRREEAEQADQDPQLPLGGYGRGEERLLPLLGYRETVSPTAVKIIPRSIITIACANTCASIWKKVSTSMGTTPDIDARGYSSAPLTHMVCSSF